MAAIPVHQWGIVVDTSRYQPTPVEEGELADCRTGCRKGWSLTLAIKIPRCLRPWEFTIKLAERVEWRRFSK
jgi:hypothetical protein